MFLVHNDDDMYEVGHCKMLLIQSLSNYDGSIVASLVESLNSARVTCSLDSLWLVAITKSS